MQIEAVVEQCVKQRKADSAAEIARQVEQAGCIFQAYLEAQNAAGAINVPDCQVAAAQFIDAVSSTTFKPVLFNFDPPTPERIEHVVKLAVRMFLAAYRKN